MFLVLHVDAVGGPGTQGRAQGGDRFDPLGSLSGLGR